MTEKLRREGKGKVREAIQQSMVQILVGANGALTGEAKPEGLLRGGTGSGSDSTARRREPRPRTSGYAWEATGR
jgi:hypothetical protein